MISCEKNWRNITCYSESTSEKCKEYSIYSDYEDLCIKCKDNYYPMLDDKSNKYGFTNCYNDNSLDKYYLDNNDLYFKSCYNSCKTCDKNGTEENHNCIICDENYEFNLTHGEYYNCYPKCDNYYYFDNGNNYRCVNNTECPNDYKYLIEEKSQCTDNCTKCSEYKYHFRNKCYNECPNKISNKSETKDYFCEPICDRDSPYELLESQLCVNNCTIN